MKRFKTFLSDFIQSILNSYAQVFFSDNRVFAVILLVVTFFDFYAGFSGFLSLVISQVAAYLIGLKRSHIHLGFYGFNSLLVGLGLGTFYQPGFEFYLLLAFASLLTLMFSVALEGVIGKYYLPYLSIPFLLGIWMVLLASRQFPALDISERGIYMLNEIYSVGGIRMVRIYQWFSGLDLPQSLMVFFKSLGAIFFQYHILSGMLIAIGLMIYSRIAFLLSLTGFYLAFLFYLLIGADFESLSYSYIGFNFILTSIAVGGFFVVPSKYSFLWVALLTPLVVIVITSLGTLFMTFQLSVYSLPFNLVVLLFLYVLKFRERALRMPQVVYEQSFSPERNLYLHRNYANRFDPAFPVGLTLPFWGEWKVTQGHSGEYTHQQEWRHAWDFEVVDEAGMTFKGEGKDLRDYFAFGRPIVAPADGIIEHATDGVEDNAIGTVNVKENWGNVIIIRHTGRLFSKLCHLRNGSVRVKQGDSVKKGAILAQCGNSGRSPVPHLHFQVQRDPYVGAPTFEYPLGNYMIQDGHKLIDRGIPEKGQIISSLERNEILDKAYHFVPGQVLHFRVVWEEGHISEENWSVQTDMYNNTFIQCRRTGARAYFVHDGSLFRFLNYKGRKRTLLYYFVLGNFKVINGFRPQMTLADPLPLNLFHPGWLIVIQDFVAPFYLFVKSSYLLNYPAEGHELTSQGISLRSACRAELAEHITRSVEFETILEKSGIVTFSVTDRNRIIVATCTET